MMLLRKEIGMTSIRQIVIQDTVVIRQEAEFIISKKIRRRDTSELPISSNL